MTEAAIERLAADMFGIVRHEDVQTDTLYTRGGHVITLTPFDGAYTVIEGQRVSAYEYDVSYAAVAKRIQRALSTTEG